MSLHTTRNSEQRYLGFLVCFLIWSSAGRVLASPRPDEGDRISVCVINSRNGKPLKNVSVVLTGPAGGFLKNQDGKVVTGTTNKFGEVALKLPSPIPERLGVFYTGGGTCELVQCSGAQTYGIAEILKAGTIGINKCSSVQKRRYSVVAKPGELIIFAEPYSGWRCAMQEIP